MTSDTAPPELDTARPRTAHTIVLGAAMIAMGLLAGLFYGWDVSVMPGLTAANDATLVISMQRLIEAIENPGFYLTFLGAPVMAVIALVQAYRSGAGNSARWIIAALALYTAMAVITFAVHFPLNDQLIAMGDTGDVEKLAAARSEVVDPWIAWNLVRTIALTAAFVSLVRAFAVRTRVA